MALSFLHPHLVGRPGGNPLQPIAEQQFCLGSKRFGPCACFPPEGSEQAEAAGRHSSAGQCEFRAPAFKKLRQEDNVCQSGLRRDPGFVLVIKRDEGWIDGSLAALPRLALNSQHPRGSSKGPDTLTQADKQAKHQCTKKKKKDTM